MSTKISDEVLQNVLVNNRLAKLETLSIQKSGQNLTMKGIELIMENCDNIKFFKDIVNFRESQLKLMYRSFRCLFTFRCHFLRSKIQLKF